MEHAGVVCIPTLAAAEALLPVKRMIVLPDYPFASFSLSAIYAPARRATETAGRHGDSAPSIARILQTIRSCLPGYQRESRLLSSL